MKNTHTVKRRRLDAEIEHLQQRISDVKAYITHDPYEEDQPALKAQLKDLQEMLQDAEKDSNEEIKDHHRKIRGHDWSVKCPRCGDRNPDVRKNKFCPCGVEFWLTPDNFISAIG